MTLKIKTIFLLTFLLNCNLDFGQPVDSYSFKLSKGDKVFKVDTSNLIDIYITHYRDKGDSVQRKVSGIFKGISKDSIILFTYFIKDHDTKKTNFFYPDIPTTKYKINGITEIITVNRKVEKSMAVVFFTSLFAGLVVSPLVSIENKKLNWKQVGTISGISGGVAVLSLVISGTFCDRHHKIKQTNKSKDLWRIDP